MPTTSPAENEALVLEAFDTLFNKRDQSNVCHEVAHGDVYRLGSSRQGLAEEIR